MRLKLSELRTKPRGEVIKFLTSGRIRTNYDCDGGGRDWVEGYVDAGNIYSDSCHLKGKNGQPGIVFSDGGTTGTWSISFYSDRWIEALDYKTNEKLTMEKVILEPEKRQQIEAAIGQLEYHDLIFEKWGFAEVFEKGTAVSLMFYGVPGTGKTMMAQAIANKLKQTLKIIQTAEVESSEPGQAERNIKAFFENAVQNNELLLFDECDSLICDRNEVGMILAGQINALLTALEAYKGVVVFTTNRLGKMDPAFERRISAKIEFPFPDDKARVKIWGSLIPKKAPLDPSVKIKDLARFPIAGGNIKNVILNAARYAAYNKKLTIDMECFEVALEKEMESIKEFEAAFADSPHIPSPVGPSAGVSRGRSRGVKPEVKKDDVIIAKLAGRS